MAEPLFLEEIAPIEAEYLAVIFCGDKKPVITSQSKGVWFYSESSFACKKVVGYTPPTYEELFKKRVYEIQD